MKKYLFLIVIIGVGIIGIVAFQTTTVEAIDSPTVFQGAHVRVVGDHSFAVHRDTGRAAITVQSSGSDMAMQWFDIDDNQIYQVLLDVNGDSLIFKDITNARNIMYFRTSDGFVGINNIIPTEQLDVNGNIHLSKLNPKITSNGDLCIGSCP